LSVTRDVNDFRIAMLALLITIALGAAQLAPGWWRLAAGVGAFVLSCPLSVALDTAPADGVRPLGHGKSSCRERA
jgi:hypothetical protein